MSSLRLALKQSLAEAVHLAFPNRTVVSHSRKKKSQSNRGKYVRKMKVRDSRKGLFRRKQEMHLKGNVNERKTREEQPTSTWRKPIFSTPNIDKNMEDSIQEFSLSSTKSNDSPETVNYEQNPSDTSTMIMKKNIGEMIKKKKKGLKESCVSLRNSNYSSPEGTPNVGSVKGPTQKVLDWFTNMSVGLQRRKILCGMRVKVRFQNTQNNMPSQKLSSPLPDHKWYGGFVTHVAKDGSRVRIRYDDGTHEVSGFPDKDIVVDAEGNGLHHVQVEEFNPDSLIFGRIKQLEKEKKEIRTGMKHYSELESKRWRKQTIISKKKDNSQSMSSKEYLIKDQNDKYDIPQGTLTLEFTMKKEVLNEQWLNEPKVSVKESIPSFIVKIPPSTVKKHFIVENHVIPLITSVGKYSLKSIPLKSPSAKRDLRKFPLKEHINLTELPLIQTPLLSMEPIHTKSNESNTQDSKISNSHRKSESRTKCTSTNISITPEKESLFVPVRSSELKPLSKEFKRNLRPTKDIDSNSCGEWKSQPHYKIGKEKRLTRIKSMAFTLTPSILFSSSNVGSISVSTTQGHNSSLSNFSTPKHSLTVPTKELALKRDSLFDKPHLLTNDIIRSSLSVIVPETSPKLKKSCKEKLVLESQRTSLSSPRPWLTGTKSKQNYSSLISLHSPKLKLSNENIKSSSTHSDSPIVVYPTKDKCEKMSLCKVLKYKPTKKRKCNNTHIPLKYTEESDDHTLSDFDEITSGVSDAENWVKCDRCEKWRLIPSCINVGDLPDEWYCELNVFDKKRNHCQAPEQTPQQVEREKKKNYLKTGISHESTRGTVQFIRNLSTSLRFKGKELPLSKKKMEVRESTTNTLKHETQPSIVSSNPASSVSSVMSPARPLLTKNIKNVVYASTPIPSTNFVTKKGTISKPINHSSTKLEINTTSVIVKEDTTTFTGTNPDYTSFTTSKLKTTTTTNTTKRTKRYRDDDRESKKTSHKHHKKQKDSNPQEWVQCEKCEKWRRLPRHISAKDLPDEWFCTMNTWDPRSASCAVHEDYKTESYRSKIRGENHILRNTTNGSSSIVPLSPTGTTGKLSYRDLIFGSNGRGSRHNRPISERISAIESLFSLYRLEDDVTTGTTTAPNKVLYANSSVFQSKFNAVAHNTTPKTDNETSKLESPLFTFLNQSQLWKDLYQGSSLTSTADNSPVTHQNKSSIKRRLQNKCMDTSGYIQSMKDIVYSVMKGETLETHELLLRCQCEDFYNTKWSELQASSTFDTIRVALEDLVNDGLVEEVHTKQNDFFFTMTTKYRRKLDRNVHEPMMNVNNQNKPETRFMKIQKPWKQTKLYTEKELCKIQE